MRIITDIEAEKIRYKYVETFIDTEKDYYLNNILQLKLFTDGMCYTGYLWDCLKGKKVIEEKKAYHYLMEKKEILLFWDIHSEERIFIPDYWKFPKRAVIKIEFEEFLEKISLFPEDIYIFDDTYTWTIVFTHETDLRCNRWCLCFEISEQC